MRVRPAVRGEHHSGSSESSLGVELGAPGVQPAAGLVAHGDVAHACEVGPALERRSERRAAAAIGVHGKACHGKASSSRVLAAFAGFGALAGIRYLAVVGSEGGADGEVVQAAGLIGESPGLEVDAGLAARAIHELRDDLLTQGMGASLLGRLP